MPSVIKSVGCVHCMYFEDLIPLRSTPDLTRICRRARLPDTVIDLYNVTLFSSQKNLNLSMFHSNVHPSFQVHPSAVESG